MNGRVYDYNSGRFLSVDPYITYPSETQAINPYSYIMNNPMAGTDPTGYVAIAAGLASAKITAAATVLATTLGPLAVPTLVVAAGVLATVIIIDVITDNGSTTDLPGELQRPTNTPSPITVPESSTSITPIPTESTSTNTPGSDITPQTPTQTTTEAGNIQGPGNMDSRGNKTKPAEGAEGPHTTWKTNPENGEITRHETWVPNDQNPSGFDSHQSTDLQGAAHTNKLTGEDINTPHTQGKGIPGGVRPATPDEIPKK